MTKYFTVNALTELPVLSDGSIDTDNMELVANAYVHRYIVSECQEDGHITDIKKYKPKDFHKIAEEHQPPEWQNFAW